MSFRGVAGRTRRCAQAALAAWAAAGVGYAAPAPDFPSSPAEADVLHWLDARTSITRASILAIDPRAVIALERQAARPDPPGVISAEVREELIGWDVASKAQARSVLISLELDCRARRFRILGRTLFALPDLQGTARNEAGSQAWAQAEETAPIGKAWRAGCDASFALPYARPLRVQATAAPAGGGPYQVVLGSFAVATNAKAAADRLDHNYADALAGRRPVIRPTTVGGRAYSVVTVAGFASPEDARAFCGRISSSKLECSVRKSAAKPAKPA